MEEEEESGGNYTKEDCERLMKEPWYKNRHTILIAKGRIEEARKFQRLASINPLKAVDYFYEIEKTVP